MSAQVLLVFLCLVLSASHLFAATTDDAARDAARIIQQQQEMQDNLEENTRVRREPAPELPDIDLPAHDDLVDTGACHFVAHVVVEGATLFSQKELEVITTPFSGRCISLQDINTILRRITLNYFDAGYITSRPYVKPQDLTGGTLELTVVEGEIGRFTYNDKNGNVNASVRFSFPAGSGRLLNLRELEQGLDQLNRLQSNNVRLSLVPGEKPGTTDVVLDNEASGKSHLSLTLDNNGTEPTGEIQGHVSFGYDNLYGIADYFGLTFSHDFHRNAGKDSRNFFTRYEVPYGWNLFGLIYRHFNYKQTVEGSSQTFPATGTTRNFSVFADRVLFRDRTRKLSFGLSLDWKDERNYLLDVLLDTSSQHFIVGRSTLKLDWYFERASLQWAVGYHRGLNILDAQDDANAPNGSPQAQFNKLISDLSVQSAIVGVPGLSYRGRVSGQYSTDMVFPSEQVSIGSLYSVRGYKLEGYSGNSGGYIRNEIAYSFPEVSSLQKVGLAKIEPFIGADWGSVKVDLNDNDGYENLQSWTVGLKLIGPNQSMNLSYSHPVDRPVGFINSDGEFVFSYTLFF